MELKEINQLLHTKKFEFLIIYGRRRIGKTELILQATRSLKSFYYLAVGEKNLDRLYTDCGRLDKKALDLRKDLEVLFEFLLERVDIIIIDECQNLIKEDKNFVHILQAFVDLRLRTTTKKLILLGSSVSIITSQVLSHPSPLFGRRTASMKLLPIPFFEINTFFPEASCQELVEIYGFADGIPEYLNKVQPPFWTWLGDIATVGRSFFRDEVEFLLRYEFEKPNTYRLILEAIAFGRTKLNDIKMFVNLPRTDLTPYLRNLIEVDLIKREVPITEHMTSRHGRYFIKDNFLKFWFRYIYPNLSSLETGVFDLKAIQETYSHYLGPVFEAVAKQYISKTQIFACEQIGRWWWQDVEIDIVALNERTANVLFCECKWQDRVDVAEILAALLEKAKLLPWHRDSRTEHYVIFAKSFGRKTTEVRGRKVRCIDLDDINRAFSNSMTV